MGRLFEGRGWFYMGRLYVMSLRKPLRTRRGGGRVVEGGDACVALAGGECDHGSRTRATGMRNAILRVITTEYCNEIKIQLI